MSCQVCTTGLNAVCRLGQERTTVCAVPVTSMVNKALSMLSPTARDSMLAPAALEHNPRFYAAELRLSTGHIREAGAVCTEAA